MVAKIGRGAKIKGVLYYNQIKVEKGKAQVLFTNNMSEPENGDYSVSQLYRSFEPYLWANIRTEKPALHISLNPDPKDAVNDEAFQSIAQDYMEQMGYCNQPFVVFKHTDTGRTHIHIVSICVDENGKKLSDKFERRRSMAICRKLEQDYHLAPATDKKQQQDELKFQPVNYLAGDIKSQIASIVRYLPKYYQFKSLGEYNALLSLFNIITEEVTGTLQGMQKHGLVYFALNEQGEKITNPFKASLFGKLPGYKGIQEHMGKCKQTMKNTDSKKTTMDTITSILTTSVNEEDFKGKLKRQGINVNIRKNADGRIYGVTYVDHNTRTIWKGSDLSKALSANSINQWWKGSKNQTTINNAENDNTNKIPFSDISISDKNIVDFQNEGHSSYTNKQLELIESFGGILPETQSEDYEELDFANQLKKKRKKKRG